MGKASKTAKQNKATYNPPKDRFTLWVTLVTIAIVVIVGIIVAITTININNASSVEASTTTPPGVVNDGFVLTAEGLTPTEPGPIDVTFTESEYSSDENNISMFIDYACPHCAEFDEANIDQIEQWLNDGTINTLTVHPMAFLAPYSVLAANTFSCTAEYAPEKMLDVHKTLTNMYADNPKATKIIQTLEQNGITVNEEYTKCIRGGKYNDFVDALTTRAQSGPIPNSSVPSVTGTPTVIVNGNRYTDNPTDATAFAGFVESITK